jgi:hypothetical protein
MNIRSELLREHSKINAEKITTYACKSKKNFDELMQCFLGTDSCVAQRSAYSVGKAVDHHKDIIVLYIPVLVAQLSRTDVHDAIIRNSLRILQEVEIPEDLHGEVMNVCFNFIEDPAAAIAFKAFSLTILHNLSKIYPELKNELKLIIEARWDTETPAFRSRGRKILKG